MTSHAVIKASSNSTNSVSPRTHSLRTQNAMRLRTNIAVVATLLLAGAGVAGAQTRSDRWQREIPGNAFELNERAVQAARANEYDRAIRLFSESLQRKPDYIAAKFNLALAYDFRERPGDDVMAERLFRDAIATAE